MTFTTDFKLGIWVNSVILSSNFMNEDYKFSSDCVLRAQNFTKLMHYKEYSNQPKIYTYLGRYGDNIFTHTANELYKTQIIKSNVIIDDTSAIPRLELNCIWLFSLYNENGPYLVNNVIRDLDAIIRQIGMYDNCIIVLYDGDSYMEFISPNDAFTFIETKYVELLQK